MHSSLWITSVRRRLSVNHLYSRRLGGWEGYSKKLGKARLRYVPIGPCISLRKGSPEPGEPTISEHGCTPSAAGPQFSYIIPSSYTDQSKEYKLICNDDSNPPSSTPLHGPRVSLIDSLNNPKNRPACSPAPPACKCTWKNLKMRNTKTAQPFPSSRCHADMQILFPWG